ncbi:hypothetical protein CCACVL1_29968 [Corchorus capsularis]|uniref:Uncharacterized protein n=1 Tax=Corchorus capsularis TaxID=210143 RepID=A0A1R3FZB1_COCAP|nr:hypothetical protein CCACVL1_29968 [Corchorus capsularis]
MAAAAPFEDGYFHLGSKSRCELKFYARGKVLW